MITQTDTTVSRPTSTSKSGLLRKVGLGAALAAASIGAIVPAAGAAEVTPAPMASVTALPPYACQGVMTPSSYYKPLLTNHARSATWRLYAAYFQRQPDYGGFTYWSNLVAGGTSLNYVSSVFADSVEFRNTYGNLSNRDFVLQVYQNVMCRNPDTAGWDYWTGLLNQGRMDRGQVMTAFSESVEFKSKTGTRY